MKISVVIPLYNKKDTVLRALQSVFAQTIQPLEIIVVNDGSTDGSERVVEELQHPLVRLVHQANAGVSAARNKGIELADGDWIAFLDADDVWDYDFLETIVGLNKKYSSAKVIATSYRYKFENVTSLPVIKYDKNEGIMDDYFEIASSGSPPLWTSAICAHKEALRMSGLFPTEVKIGEDLITWARLAFFCQVAYIADPKSNYAFPINIGIEERFRMPDEVDYVGNELRKLLHGIKDKKKINSFKKYISHWHKMRLALFAFNSQKHKSWNEFKSCIKYNPSNLKAYALLIFAFLPLSGKSIVLKNFSFFK